MRITDIKDITPTAINNMLFIGAAGIGKTEEIKRYAENYAKSENLKFVDLRKTYDSDVEHNFYYLRIIAPHLFPEDVSIPKERQNEIEYLSPKIIEIFSKENAKGLIFIDELNNVARPDQRVLFYSLIQEREIGFNKRLSDNIIIVSAGNPTDWSSDANTLPMPLINRMTLVNIESSTPESWIDYMYEKYGDKWDKRISVFLMQNKAKFLEKPPEEALENFPSPRSWTNLSVKLFDNPKFMEELVRGNIGDKLAPFLIQFLTTKVIKLEDFVKNYKIYDSLSLTERLMLIYTISNNWSSFLEKKEFKEIIDTVFIKKHRDDLVLILKLLPKKEKEKSQTDKLISQLVDDLVK